MLAAVGAGWVNFSGLVAPTVMGPKKCWKRKISPATVQSSSNSKSLRCRARVEDGSSTENARLPLCRCLSGRRALEGRSWLPFISVEGIHCWSGCPEMPRLFHEIGLRALC